MEEFLKSIYSYLCITYIIANIFFIYQTIVLIKNLFCKKELSTGTKQFISLIVSILIALIYFYFFNKDAETLFISAIFSFVFYEYIVKFIIRFIQTKTKQLSKDVCDGKDIHE